MLIEHAFMQTCSALNNNIKYQRGTLAMLRTAPSNLCLNKKDKLIHFFKGNPAIENLYHFKNRLIELLKHKHLQAFKCKKLIPIFLDFIHQLKNAVFEPLVKLGNTLYKWRDEISQNVAFYQEQRNHGRLP